MNVCQSLTSTAQIFPDRTALVFGDQKISYAQLNLLSIKAAQQLSAAGVQPGDRVAMMLPNAPSFPIWYYAILRIGAIAVSVSTRLAASEVRFVIEDCDAKVFVCCQPVFESSEEEQAPPACLLQTIVVDGKSGSALNQTTDPSEPTETTDAADNTWYEARPDEAALILYTSGTTGFPKGATLSHANVRSNVHAFNHLCNMQPDDRVLLAVPLFHCFGQNALLNSVLNVGGTIVLQQRFDLNETKHLIQQHQITQLYGVPMMFGLLLESCTPEDLASVSYCFSAAAPLPIQTSHKWQEKFDQPIFEGYGLTETSPFATYNHRLKFQPGSIGTAIDSVEIKIVDTETGVDCPPGKLGEIAIRGPNVMLGYWNRPEETATAIRDGWFHSGDIGQIDPQGYLYIVDRVKDMIAVGGLKVFPAEVERTLLDHPAIAQVAVIGVPDPVFGEQVLGYVVLSEEAGPDPMPAIEQFARQNLGNYKIPRSLIPIDELPRNPSGKILKTKLRELASQSNPDANLLAPAGSPAATNQLRTPELLTQLSSVYDSEKKRVATEYLQNLTVQVGELDETPDPQASFIEAGLDSLAIVQVSVQIQHEVGAENELPATILFDYPRISDLAGFIVDRYATGTNASADQAKTISEQGGTSTSPVNPAISGPHFLRDKIENMSEDEALSQLMKELND